MADEAYFRDVIQPLLSQPHVEFVGEINDAQKSGSTSICSWDSQE